jgi:hypothetical protein
MSRLQTSLRRKFNTSYRPYIGGVKVFQKSRNNLKFLSARMVTLRKFYTEYPQTLGVTVQNLVARAAWRSEFVHRCLTCIKGLVSELVYQPNCV